MKIVIMIAAAVAAIADAQLSRDQLEMPMERAYPIEENYEIYQYQNVTASGDDCKCQSNFIRPEWNQWSICQGSESTFSCHGGIRYRSRQCAAAPSACNHREWRYCYHQSTCNGVWVDWKDPDAQCTRPCGGGFKAQLRICRRNREIGLFCESTHRRPYDLSYVPCNTEPCEEISYPPIPSVMAKPISDNNTSDITIARTSLEPNLSTWIAAGAGGALLLIVIATAVCVSRCQANSRYQQKKRNAEGNEKNSEEMNNLTPPNGNETETTLPLPPPPSSMNTLTRTGTDFNELPQVPPHLHHSFNKGHVVPSESVVYTLPKTSHLQENTKTKLIGSIPEGGTFFESSTPFCLPGSRPCSTMDHPMVTAGYFETSSPPPYPQNNAALPGFQSRRPTVESMQSSPGGVLPDIPSTQKHYINRPDNHIYADIHPQP